VERDRWIESGQDNYAGETRILCQHNKNRSRPQPGGVAKNTGKWTSRESRVEADNQEASSGWSGRRASWIRWYDAEGWVDEQDVSKGSRMKQFRIDYRFRFFFGGCVTAQSGQYHLTLLGGALSIPTHS